MCAFLILGIGEYAARENVAASILGNADSSRPNAFAARIHGRTLAGNHSVQGASLTNSPLSPFVAGDLDTTFGGSGKVTTQFGGEEDVATSLVLQSDGKIVCSGYSASAVSTIAFVARYNSDGSLDASFGTAGKATQDFGAGFSSATSVALQSDGKIVVAGYARPSAAATTGFDFFVLRYNANGTLDTAFGAGGRVITDFSAVDEADVVLIQTDGKIVVTGSTSNNSLDRTFAALARYNTDGSLDASFGTAGKVIGHEGSAYSAVLQPDGRLVTGGWGCAIATCTSNLDFTFARYDTAGALDPAFGTSGKATVAVSTGRDEAHSIVLQSDGKIVASGVNLNSPTANPVAIVRLNANGSLDTTFGTGGIVQGLPIVVEDAFGVSLQSSGKIITGGRVFTTATDSDFAIVRLNTNGTLDTTFSNGGIATTLFSGNFDGITDTAIQSDGKIVAVGFAGNQAGGIDAAMARYLTSVSVSGRVTSPSGAGLRNATVVITDSLGGKQFATTSSFGFYTFDNVRPGDTYQISVNSRLYRFAVQSFAITDNLTNIDFAGLE